MNIPLMSKATAVWLVDNTTLTFDQIADFCGLHPLEVQGIADGEVAKGIIGVDPTTNGQLTKEEIVRCQLDNSARLKLSDHTMKVIKEQKKVKKKSRYTPISRRQDKPNAIAWILKNCPEMTEIQIIKLIGTTKTTIASVKDKTHWNHKNIKPRDPVLLGLCSQTDLNIAYELAKEKAMLQNQEREKN